MIAGVGDMANVASLPCKRRQGCLALVETVCLAGHVGFEPANPSASHLIGFA